MRDWASGRPLLRVPESCAGREGEQTSFGSAPSIVELVPVAVALLSRPKTASDPLLSPFRRLWSLVPSAHSILHTRCPMEAVLRQRIFAGRVRQVAPLTTTVQAFLNAIISATRLWQLFFLSLLLLLLPSLDNLSSWALRLAQGLSPL